jgi:hypothetical protein
LSHSVSFGAKSIGLVLVLQGCPELLDQTGQRAALDVQRMSRNLVVVPIKPMHRVIPLRVDDLPPDLSLLGFPSQFSQAPVVKP